jgi:hypothetical protein
MDALGFQTISADLNPSAMLIPEIFANATLPKVLLPNIAVIKTMTITPSLGYYKSFLRSFLSKLIQILLNLLL